MVQETLDTADRDPASFFISKRVYVAVDGNEDRAEGRLCDWFARHYGSADMGSQVAVWGSMDKCAEGLQEIVDAGAQMLMLNPMFEQMEHLMAFHEALAFPASN